MSTANPGPAKGKSSKGGRSAARLAAVQGLYQMDIAGTDLNAVMRDLTDDPVSLTAVEDVNPAEAPVEMLVPDATFLAELLRGVVRRQRDIDPMIDAQLASGWRLARVDSILRAILRAGVFELVERTDVPARAVINEYVEIAHAFLSHDDPKVVNGVLDKLAHRLRPAEFDRSAPG